MKKVSQILSVFAALFKVLIVGLAFSSSVFASASGGLTGIERVPCLMFPEITKPEVAVAGTSYLADFSVDCNDSWQPERCIWFQTLHLIYRYNIVTTTDYYNSDGKIIVSKDKKERMTFMNEDFESHQDGSWAQSSKVGLIPNDDAAKTQMKRQYEKVSVLILDRIQDKLSEETEVCGQSFYK